MLIAFAFSIGLLYGKIFGQPFREYVVYLVSGLSVWYLVQSFFIEGSGSAIESAPIIQNLPMSFSTLAARVVARNVLIFGHNLLACAFILIVLGWGVNVNLLWLLPAACAYAALGFGVCLILGPLGARFRDIPQLVATIMQLVLFLSPIIWPPTLIDPSNPAIRFNPLFHIIEIGRSSLLGNPPTLENWLVTLGVVSIALGGGVVSFMSTRERLFYWT